MGVIRKTKTVAILLKEFDAKQATAISAKGLIEKLKDQFNKTTIYRLLDKLEDDGVLHSFLGKDGLKWYAKCRGCSSKEHQDLHPHFQCLCCGKVDCLPNSVKIPELPNRKIAMAQLLIQGTCEDCLV